MRFIVNPTKRLENGVRSDCGGKCSANCMAKCNTLGECFCTLKGFR